MGGKARLPPPGGSVWLRGMKTHPIGFALVGCGLIADFHAQAIAASSEARLVAVVGRNREKTAAFAAKHRVPFATTDLAEALARPEVEVVAITTPSGAHLEPALVALTAGRHLLIEKPIEITLERIDRLLTAAARAGVYVAGVFQARFGAGAQTVHAAVQAGRLGRLVSASAHVKWYRAPEYYRDSWHGTLALDGGGALINQAIHGLDLLQWWAGMPEEVFAWTTRRAHTQIEGEDTAQAVLRFPGGALGAIEASTAVFPGFSRRIELCGTEGSIVLEDDRITTWRFRVEQPGDEAVRAGAKQTDLGSGAAAPQQINFVGHQWQIEDLARAIREGRPPKIEGAEARKAVALVRALYASAASNRPVRLG